ncbi:DUF2811 domain-containing protein [Spirulina subsalsa FACHB-351]|uniref:DUF2811 domain-containing protein n=1 Tax=Spirulina subsalsa FACHB-351 TaxID=234711 RepID=A0ABT3LA13_9CYAN|nr:DUF2811 domain-containing protein [Spirulina subsalsa]MCW6038329.1 DUF2811 domain-containing protein [Spirulina subsalsa FACHB-351]
MKTNISILAEIPEELHASLKTYLDTHPNWDQDRVLAAALSLFLLQRNDDSSSETLGDSSSETLGDRTLNPNYRAADNYQTCAKVYLETLFHS